MYVWWNEIIALIGGILNRLGISSALAEEVFIGLISLDMFTPYAASTLNFPSIN